MILCSKKYMTVIKEKKKFDSSAIFSTPARVT